MKKGARRRIVGEKKARERGSGCRTWRVECKSFDVARGIAAAVVTIRRARGVPARGLAVGGAMGCTLVPWMLIIPLAGESTEIGGGHGLSVLPSGEVGSVGTRKV